MDVWYILLIKKDYEPIIAIKLVRGQINWVSLINSEKL